jgi:rhodanese-related sulfurtransferase
MPGRPGQTKESKVNFLIENAFLVLMAVVSGAMLAWPALRRGGQTGVSVTEAVALINREKGVLVDVGEPQEFQAAHASGARNIPYGQIEGATGLPKNKTLPVILLCPSGARASRAATLLRKQGHERAVAVLGGTSAWREAQMPMEKAATSEA